MIVLGIDPGSQITGFGIIKSDNASHYKLIHYGCIRLTDRDFFRRLKSIHEQIGDLINEYSPDTVALEDIFFQRNIKSALQLGQARGAAIIAALYHDKTIYSYGL